jgi:hypothetical protein
VQAESEALHGAGTHAIALARTDSGDPGQFAPEEDERDARAVLAWQARVSEEARERLGAWRTEAVELVAWAREAHPERRALRGRLELHLDTRPREGAAGGELEALGGEKAPVSELHDPGQVELSCLTGAFEGLRLEREDELVREVWLFSQRGLRQDQGRRREVQQVRA